MNAPKYERVDAREIKAGELILWHTKNAVLVRTVQTVRPLTFHHEGAVFVGTEIVFQGLEEKHTISKKVCDGAMLWRLLILP